MENNNFSLQEIFASSLRGRIISKIEWIVATTCFVLLEIYLILLFLNPKDTSFSRNFYLVAAPLLGLFFGLLIGVASGKSLICWKFFKPSYEQIEVFKQKEKKRLLDLIEEKVASKKRRDEEIAELQEEIKNL